MAAWWIGKECWDTCRGQAWRCFRVTRFAFRDFGLAAHVLGHDDAVAISEFQKFEIDMGVLTVSIIRSAVTPQEVRERFRQGLPRGRQAQGHHHRCVHVLYVGRCQVASHDRCRCHFLANRNSVVHVAGFRRHPTPSIVPTTLGLGIWKDQVAEYKTQWDPQRPLQSKRLRGAEIVLARLLHESLVPRLLTPVSVEKNFKRAVFVLLGW